MMTGIDDPQQQQLMDDRRQNQIDNTVGISRERVENILHNELWMSKVSARCVPLLLTPDKKLTRLTLSQANLFIFEADQASFLDRFLTQDECWIHYFESETKRQSMQWKHPAHNLHRR